MALRVRNKGKERVCMTSVNDIMQKLREYFQKTDDIAMAFLFGSMSTGAVHLESDMDIAVYLNRELSEIEESGIWADVEKISGINVDFVVLNRAFPLIADKALKGIPIIIKDKSVYLGFLLSTISEAIDYRTFLESYWRLKQGRSHVA